jgi:hypothetical protein
VPLTGVSAAAAGTRAVAGARTGASAGTWGTAREVPGLGALNTAGTAQVSSVSCVSGGNCSAVGFYSVSSARHGATQQVFVAVEVKGAWHRAIEIPGTAALNTGSVANVGSVSCASVGNCGVGGLYTARSGVQVFVANEVNGTWRAAEEVPGIEALNKSGSASINSMSCASAGNCSVGGTYIDGPGRTQSFVAGEKNGTWGKAKAVPGLATLNKGGVAVINAVSCASAGTCSAGGVYTEVSGHEQGFVVNEVKGTWGTAKAVPGLAALSKTFHARVTWVSCASAGWCSAGGWYTDGAGATQAFVAGETKGTWGKAKEVPGTAALNKGGNAAIASLSCTSVGTCGAGGSFADSSSRSQVFAVSEKNGVWGTAKAIPGAAALNKGGDDQIISLSCAGTGNCGAGGLYLDRADALQAFVVSEANSTWATAEKVPGLGALDTGHGAEVLSLSCGSPDHCSAGGFYSDKAGHEQGFVVSEG